MSTRDLALEQLFPVLRTMPYTITSAKDPGYNCVAFAVGDLTQF